MNHDNTRRQSLHRSCPAIQIQTIKKRDVKLIGTVPVLQYFPFCVKSKIKLLKHDMSNELAPFSASLQTVLFPVESCFWKETCTRRV